MRPNRPLLAATGSLDKLESLTYPVLVSEKIDGIRCLITDEGPRTRSFKLIPNLILRSLLSRIPFMYDGELIGEGLNYNETQSLVLSREWNPSRPVILFKVFDNLGTTNESYMDLDFYDRKERVYKYDYEDCGYQLYVRPVEQVLCYNRTDIERHYRYYLENLKSEGIMIRSLDGRYKEGRSTLREGILIKLKPEDKDKGTVIGFEPLKSNLNPQEQDNFGLSKRSSSQGGLITLELVGNLIVRTEKWGEISIGSGMTQDQRKLWFDNPDLIVGKIVEYKYQSLGMKNKPRFPVLIGVENDYST